VLLTSLYDLRPGMRVGAVVLNPTNPQVTLLKPGAVLTNPVIAGLRKLGTTQVWVEHHLTRDLDEAVNPEVLRVKLAVYNHLKEDLGQLAGQAITNTHIGTYRRAIIDMVKALVAHRSFAGLADRIFDTDARLVSHCTNTAYLATIVGLQLESYVVSERPKVPEKRARNLVNLGLGAMLHDVGKVRLDAEDASRHEVLQPLEEGETSTYDTHPMLGYEMLRGEDIPPTVRHVARYHHHRFNGTGWPQQAVDPAAAAVGGSAGRRLHIFTRIVSAANVLDNLMQDTQGGQRPPVAALCDFASPRFDGWFDPIVRMAMLRCLAPFPIGSQVELNDGRQAVVIEPNSSQPCRPTVRLLDSADSDNPTTIRLADDPQAGIARYAGHDVRPWVFELAVRTPAPPAEAA